MKIITVGSCLSNLTASHLVSKYGLMQTHSVHHNRSDNLINYFIEKSVPQIPLDYLNSLLKPKEEHRKAAHQFINNQYDENLGFHDLANTKLPNQTFMNDIQNNKYDVILLDNLPDISYLLLYPTDMPEYSKSGLFLNLGFYEGEEELSKKFKYGAFLSPEESVSNHIKIITFLKIHQPQAKIFFLPFHHTTSKHDLERHTRIIDFYEKFKDWAYANDIVVIPPLDIDNSLMANVNDWTHFKMHVYEALAGTIYLNLFCNLPKPSKRHLTIHGIVNQQKNCLKENPYLGLPDTSFWKRSVSQLPPEEVNLILAPKFNIKTSDRISSAGSCFAQYISKVLASENYDFFITETEPVTPEAKNEGYGIFPARFGNIYTVRQLRQLLERSLNIITPVIEPWRRSDGKYVDPIRPTIQESGFITPDGVLIDTKSHLNAVRKMFIECDIFIFTLGLTEGWIKNSNAIAVPIAPGVAGGSTEISEYSFHNFTYQECYDDLIYFVDQIKAFNPKIKIILTVSPVPLVATYENEHVLSATIYSKSVLRAAAGVVAKSRTFVDYFPSYELITGNFNRAKFFKENLREIDPEGVAYVMHHFRNNYLKKSINEIPEICSDQSMVKAAEPNIEKYQNEISDVICDEELLDKVYKK